MLPGCVGMVTEGRRLCRAAGPLSGPEPYVYLWLMDFWIPLLGGALGAALVNGIVAMYKLRRDREVEHEQWLRDQKLELYANFLDAYTELYKQIKLARSAGSMPPNFDSFISQASPTRISLVAPDEIARMANDIYQQLLWLVLTLSLKPAPANVAEDERKYGEKSRVFESAAINDMKRRTNDSSALEPLWPRLKRAWAGPQPVLAKQASSEGPADL